MFLLLLVITLTTVCAQEPWATQALHSLSLDEKIGQLFIAAASAVYDTTTGEMLASKPTFHFPYNTQPEHIENMIIKHHVGGLIFLRKGTIRDQVRWTNRFQSLSKMPLLITQDCEWGLSMRLSDAVVYPRNQKLGELMRTNWGLVYQFGKEVGRQCRAIGVHMNFAPVVDVNNNPLNPVIKDRSFGDDPELVREAGMLVMGGMQDAGILTCAKHFPGHGDTDTDSHLALPTIRHDRARLDALELKPFRALIAGGVDSVMNAHMLVPALDDEIVTFSPRVIKGLLQNELGFKGLVVTDGLGMQALPQLEPGELELRAVLAGNELLVCPLDIPAAIEKIKGALAAGLLTEDDLDARVLKILRAKEKVGLTRRPEALDADAVYAALHTPAAYALRDAITA